MCSFLLHHQSPKHHEQSCIWLRWSINKREGPKSTRDILDSRQILHTTTTNQNDTVLLKVMTFSLYIRHNRLSVCQFDTSDLPLSWIGFLWCPNHNLGTNTFALGTLLQKRGAGKCCSTWRRLFAFHGLVHGSERRRSSMKWAELVQEAGISGVDIFLYV